MSRKIIGVTVGTQLPKPNFKQNDPTKGDYIRNKPIGTMGQVVGFDVNGNMVAQDDTVIDAALFTSGAAADAKATGDAITNINSEIEILKSLDAQVDWNQTDETAIDFILNKPVPITDDEIDAICGGALILDLTESVLTDITTGAMYKIYVEDGKLNMKEAEVAPSMTSTNITDINIEKLMLVDIATDTVHEVYVQDGKLHMTEVE